MLCFIRSLANRILYPVVKMKMAYINCLFFSTKKNVMDSEDTMWVKKYPAFIVNKVLSGFSDTIMLVNEGQRFGCKL